MNLKNIVRFTENCARDHVWDVDISQQLCAVLVRSGIPLVVGFNQLKTSAFQKKFEHSAFINSIHAEVDAVLKAQRKKIDVSKCELFVLRLMRKRDEFGVRMLGLAKPCPTCQMVLFTHNVKRVYYTTGQGCNKDDNSSWYEVGVAKL